MPSFSVQALRDRVGLAVTRGGTISPVVSSESLAISRQARRGGVAKWLRRRSAKPLFGGSNPPAASTFPYPSRQRRRSLQRALQRPARLAVTEPVEDSPPRIAGGGDGPRHGRPSADHDPLGTPASRSRTA